MAEAPHLPKDIEPAANILMAKPRLEIDAEPRRIALLLQLNAADVTNGGLLRKLSPVGFTPKAEFHVTALDIKQGSGAAVAFDNLGNEGQATAIDILERAGASLWQIKPRDEFYIVEKEYEEGSPRTSVVQLVDCPELDSLYGQLNVLTSDGARFEAPPTHITLATQGSSRGIGISSLHELYALSTPFTIPDQP